MPVDPAAGWTQPNSIECCPRTPWSVMVGGQAGACKFTGTDGDGGSAVIGANQMFKASAAEASGFVKDLRAPM